MGEQQDAMIPEWGDHYRLRENTIHPLRIIDMGKGIKSGELLCSLYAVQKAMENIQLPFVGFAHTLACTAIKIVTVAGMPRNSFMLTTADSPEEMLEEPRKTVIAKDVGE